MTHDNLVRRFFTGTGSTYDFIVNLFTYGADRYWKHQILSAVPTFGKILDLACGTGILTFMIAKRCRSCRIVGVDMMEEYIRIAKRKSRQRGLKHLDFVCGRAEEIALRETFDCVTSSYIPKYVPAELLLENVTPSLRPGGRLVLHDFTYPSKRAFRRLWELHMVLMKYAGTPFFPRWRTIFDELGDLVRKTQWLSDYERELRRLGYVEIRSHRYTAGSAAVIHAKRPNNFRSESILQKPTRS